MLTTEVTRTTGIQVSVQMAPPLTSVTPPTERLEPPNILLHGPRNLLQNVCFLRSTTATLSHVLTEVQTQVQQLTISDPEAHQRQLENAQKRVTELEGQLDTSQTEAQQHATNLARVQEERERARTEVADLTQQVQAQATLLTAMETEREQLRADRAEDQIIIHTLRQTFRTETELRATITTEMEHLLTEYDALNIRSQEIETALNNTYRMLNQYRRAHPNFVPDPPSPDSTDTQIVNPATTEHGPIRAPPLPTEGFDSMFGGSFDGRELLSPPTQGNISAPETGTPHHPRHNTPNTEERSDSEDEGFRASRTVSRHTGPTE